MTIRRALTGAVLTVAVAGAAIALTGGAAQARPRANPCGAVRTQYYADLAVMDTYKGLAEAYYGNNDDAYEWYYAEWMYWDAIVDGDMDRLIAADC
jgi:hypothetical protein